MLLKCLRNDIEHTIKLATGISDDAVYYYYYYRLCHVMLYNLVDIC